MQDQELVGEVQAVLEREPAEKRLDAALGVVARAFDARTATLHRTRPGSSTLELVSQLGLPEQLIPVVKVIPFGKGMAGLCAERRAPVSLCNLQTDASGDARPGAKQTGVEGAISIPVLSAAGELLGTLGIGKPVAHDYTPDEEKTLLECASALGRVLGSPAS
jgi:L-methionine (R)-S-oxide reductase